MDGPIRQHVTKSEYAYEAVRELILDGRLEPGQVLNQATLAVRIGTSTTPLREALRRLKGEGLVELDAHRDGRVTPLTGDQARDLLEMRQQLEPLAVGLAAERRSEAEAGYLRLAHERMESLPSTPSYEQLVRHRTFHATLYRASGNRLLIESLDGLWTTADRYRRMGLQDERDPAAREKNAAEHQALLDCVVARDAEGAAAVMREHIDASLGAGAQ